MDEQLIQFHALEKDWIAAPGPAAKSLPDWYKKLAGKVQPAEGAQGGQGVQTVKQCMPFLDALSSGYIIPLSGDVHFSMDEAGTLSGDCPNGDTRIETHHPAQAIGSPWENKVVVKFVNPWVIVTPPGYSTLFLPPLNHEPIPFRILAGVVDTDRLYAPVHFPAVCLMSRGSTCVLKRQTPLVQVIPIKREAWQSRVGHADAQRLNEFTSSIAHSHHVYREQFHRKKLFD